MARRRQCSAAARGAMKHCGCSELNLRIRLKHRARASSTTKRGFSVAPCVAVDPECYSITSSHLVLLERVRESSILGILSAKPDKVNDSNHMDGYDAHVHVLGRLKCKLCGPFRPRIYCRCRKKTALKETSFPRKNVLFFIIITLLLTSDHATSKPYPHLKYYWW